MNNDFDKSIYDQRWKTSKNTKDESILALQNPKTQVSFFYYHYNRLIYNIISDHFESLKGLDVLEIGCGRATASIYLNLKAQVNIFPTDYSENAIDIANKNLLFFGLQPNATVQNLFDMNKSKKYDVVISLGVMEHMPDSENAYKKMLELLKPNGLMISMNVPEKYFSVQTLATPINRILITVNKLLNNADSKPWLDAKSRSKTGSVYRTYADAFSFRLSCLKAGFIDVETFEVNPFPTIDPLPDYMDSFITSLYIIAMVFRSKFNSRNSFMTNKHLSRCHFVVGTAPSQ